MIYDTLDHIEQYAGISEGLTQGLRFLKEAKFTGEEHAEVELDGRRVFAIFQTYDTRPENSMPESHQKYIDIQYLIEGKELVGVAPLSDMAQVVSADPERDIWFYHGSTVPLPLEGDRFLVLFPWDAHAPGIAAGAVSPVRKCVVKVAMTSD